MQEAKDMDEIRESQVIMPIELVDSSQSGSRKGAKNKGGNDEQSG